MKIVKIYVDDKEYELIEDPLSISEFRRVLEVVASGGGSSKTEADSGLKLQINMISYNTTNGELSFNQMTFTPDN